MRTERTKRTQRTPHTPILPNETLEVSGRRELLIDGVLGIAAYSKEFCRIRTRCGFIGVTGKAIILCWSGEKRLLLRGELESIAFEPTQKTKKGE